jgi:hypothetical protein
MEEAAVEKDNAGPKLATLICCAMAFLLSLCAATVVQAEPPDVPRDVVFDAHSSEVVWHQTLRLTSEYDIRYFSLDDGQGTFELLRQGKRVYYEGLNSALPLRYGIVDPENPTIQFFIISDNRKGGSRYCICDLEDTASADSCTVPQPGHKIPIKDLTGDGIPDLVMISSSGGAHCCFETIVFSLGATVKKVATFDAGHSNRGFQFKDLDGDGVYEAIGPDWTFAYWNTAFGGSPAPVVTYRYVTGVYRLALDLMRKPPASRNEIEECLRSIRDGKKKFQAERIRPQFSVVGPLMWGFMLDLIYSGNGDQAMKFFDEAWSRYFQNVTWGDIAHPEEVTKERFLRDFRKQLSKSKDWPGIRRMNGWK